MKKSTKYLILGIIILTAVIAIINTIIFGDVTINMMPSPMNSDYTPFSIKVFNKQKGLLPFDFGLTLVFTALYTFTLYKKQILSENKKNIIFFIIVLMVVPLFIALNIYLKYTVQVIW